RTGECATPDGGSSPIAQDYAYGPRCLVHGEDINRERRIEGSSAASLWLPHAIGACGAVGRWVQPPDAENRTSGGVGGWRAQSPPLDPIIAIDRKPKKVLAGRKDFGDV